MTFTRPVLVVFHGSMGDCPAETMMAHARAASSRASAQAALAAGFEAVIIATDDPAAFDPAEPGILIEEDTGESSFRMFERLTEIVQKYQLERPATMGSGSLPLFRLDDFRFVAEQLEQRGRRFVTNNFYSADLTGWTPGSAIHSIDPVERDNHLPRKLREQTDLSPVMLPRTTATQFDLDTPSDLAILSLQQRLPMGLAAAVRAVDIDSSHYRAVMPLFCDRTAEIVVAGRVGSQTWHYLERETACRVRMFSEERGMAVADPGHRPRSILGFLSEEVGPERFFELMSRLGDALIIDTRVIEAHLGLGPSREDRFQSDMLQPEAISDPWLRRFTAAAAAAPVPVLLGGHSLVSGGLMALNDAAWLENDRIEGRGL
jgi:hypothetical protein